MISQRSCRHTFHTRIIPISPAFGKRSAGVGDPSSKAVHYTAAVNTATGRRKGRGAKQAWRFLLDFLFSHARVTNAQCRHNNPLVLHHFRVFRRAGSVWLFHSPFCTQRAIATRVRKFGVLINLNQYPEPPSAQAPGRPGYGRLTRAHHREQSIMNKCKTSPTYASVAPCASATQRNATQNNHQLSCDIYARLYFIPTQVAHRGRKRTASTIVCGSVHAYTAIKFDIVWSGDHKPSAERQRDAQRNKTPGAAAQQWGVEECNRPLIHGFSDLITCTSLSI